MNRGLSLIEVLVSLTVASLSIAALAHSAWSILQARRASDVQHVATLLAERRLEALVAAGASDLSPTDRRDRVLEAAVELGVHTRIEPGPNDRLWHLAVVVSPSQGAPVRLHTLLRRNWRLP